MDYAQGRGLRDHLNILRRRVWWIVAIIVLTVAAVVVATSQQAPVYESSAEVIVEPLGTAAQATTLERAILGRTDMPTQQRMVLSIPVAERAAEHLGLETSPQALIRLVEVRRISDTSILEVAVKHADRRFAADLAQAFAVSYLEVRRDRGVERMRAATVQLREQAEELRSRIDEVDVQISEQQADEEASGVREAQLLQERDTLFIQLGQVTAQIASHETAAGLGEGGEILRPAEVPSEPVSPQPVRNAALALVLGLVLGLGVAYGMDQLDDAIRSDDDVKRAVGRPVLAYVPRWRDVEKTERVASIVEPWSPAAEAYRTLRTNIRFLAGAQEKADAGEAAASVVITSAILTEGKTTTAANLAVAAARAGSRVMLVDADLRRPDLARLFAHEQTRGLSELLAGEVDMKDPLVDVGVPNLRLLPSGSVPPNPAELLSSPRMRRLHAKLSQLADLVIYDTPPVLAVADSLEVAPLATVTLLVVDVGESHRRALRSAAERLARIDVEVAGCVMNNVTSGGGYYGYGYYRYEYTPRSEKEPAGAAERA